MSEILSDRHMVDLTEMDAFTTLVVRTDNSVYRITILRPHAREVLVQGGKFFTERTRACLSGSSFGGSCFEDRLGRSRAAPGVPLRGPADHHVASVRDRGRGVPDRSTSLGVGG